MIIPFFGAATPIGSITAGRIKNLIRQRKRVVKPKTVWHDITNLRHGFFPMPRNQDRRVGRISTVSASVDGESQGTPRNEFVRLPVSRSICADPRQGDLLPAQALREDRAVNVQLPSLRRVQNRQAAFLPRLQANRARVANPPLLKVPLSQGARGHRLPRLRVEQSQSWREAPTERSSRLLRQHC